MTQSANLLVEIKKREDSDWTEVPVFGWDGSSLTDSHSEYQQTDAVVADALATRRNLISRDFATGLNMKMDGSVEAIAVEALVYDIRENDATKCDFRYTPDRTAPGNNIVVPVVITGITETPNPGADAEMSIAISGDGAAVRSTT